MYLTGTLQFIVPNASLLDREWYILGSESTDGSYVYVSSFKLIESKSLRVHVECLFILFSLFFKIIGGRISISVTVVCLHSQSHSHFSMLPVMV
jgi:hypothetical protein